jgi:hypothetical protein
MVSNMASSTDSNLDNKAMASKGTDQTGMFENLQVGRKFE